MIIGLGYDAIEVIEDEYEQWYILLKSDMIINIKKINGRRYN